MSLHGSGALVAFGGVLLLASLAAIVAPDVAALLEYRRDAILAGEAWRVLTGQCIHLGAAHLLLNLVGLALVAVIAAAYGRWPGATVVLATGAGTGALLLLLAPDVAWYRGASGLLHGLLAWLLLQLVRDGERSGWFALLALLAKVVGEQMGAAPAAGWVSIGGPVVTVAHACGFLVGAIVFAVERLAAGRSRDRPVR